MGLPRAACHGLTRDACHTPLLLMLTSWLVGQLPRAHRIRLPVLLASDPVCHSPTAAA